ncbi:MAG: secondary thiamine-phosphate synthase enzyme YjbQ [Candidatus Omnitrophica bacterium]|nr:secondary thiamine-phosphate synthase enzyme YjbQ [Candidatus Omnitrophota bacterium]
MKTISRQLQFETKGYCDIIDITSEVDEALKKSKLRAGIISIICSGSTGALTTCEYESGLIEDLKRFFERIIPENQAYDHNKRWGDGNGFSHVRASLIGPSLTIPFNKGRLILGTWQQIIFIDFDNRPRGRKIHLQIMGE